MSDLPVACTLTPGDLAARRSNLLPGLVAQAESREELADGWRYRFAATGDVLQRITAVIDSERQCCRFLRFQLTVEPDGGPLVLDVTGPSGTREFLSQIIEP